MKYTDKQIKQAFLTFAREHCSTSDLVHIYQNWKLKQVNDTLINVLLTAFSSDILYDIMNYHLSEKDCSTVLNNVLHDKKQTFQIEIEETLSRVIPIEAESLSDAIALAKKHYYDEEIILSSEDLITTEFNLL